MHINYQSNLFLSAPPLSSIEVTIVVPVKDEETYIQDLLKSLKDQVDLSGKKINYNRYEILILANNCTDDTVDLIKRFKLENRKINLYLEEVILETDEANIGFVRKSLMDTAYMRLMKNGGGLIMTTDGDTVVSNDWLAQNIEEINNAADAVGGRILLKEDEYQALDCRTSYFYQKDEEYQLLASELEANILENFDYRKSCHHQHFNGSFAVTTACYQQTGGIPLVKHLEDCAFYDRLLIFDAKVRHSDKVVVRTSGRWVGRTDLGLSYQLNIWKNTDIQRQSFLVESCESLLYRFTVKSKLKKLWKRRNLSDIVIEHELQNFHERIIYDDNIVSIFKTSNYFGEWFQKIEHLNHSTWAEKFERVEIDEALKNLRSILHKE